MPGLIIFFLKIMSSVRSHLYSGLSTSDAVVEYLDCVCNLLSCKDVFIAITSDFKRVFDTVNHQIISQRYKESGFFIDEVLSPG